MDDTAQQQLRLIRDEVFAWQSVFALRKIKESFSGIKVTIAKGIYTTITELANNKQNQNEFDTFLSSVYTMCEMDERTVKPYLDKFVELGLIELSEQEREKGKYGKIKISIKSQLSPSYKPCTNGAQTVHKPRAQNPDIKKHLLEASLRSISKKKEEKINKKKSEALQLKDLTAETLRSATFLAELRQKYFFPELIDFELETEKMIDWVYSKKGSGKTDVLRFACNWIDTNLPPHAKSSRETLKVNCYDDQSQKAFFSTLKVVRDWVKNGEVVYNKNHDWYERPNRVYTKPWDVKKPPG